MKTLQRGQEIAQIEAALRESPCKEGIAVRMDGDCYRALVDAGRVMWERSCFILGKPLPENVKRPDWMAGMTHPETKEDISFLVVVDGSVPERCFEVVSI